MRNVHGICPECHNRISIDLDAAVVECPICHRRLKTKKSNAPDVAQAKTPTEGVTMPPKVEKQAAKEAVPAAVANAFMVPQESAPIEDTQPTETAAPVETEVPAEQVAETEAPIEEVAETEGPAEQVAEATLAETAAPKEETMSEAEAMALAASLDEGAPVDVDVPQETEEAPVTEEETDPNEISPEELALMDDVPPQEAAAPSDETIVYSSISAEEDKPVTDEDEEQEEIAEEEETLGEGLKELSADTAADDLTVEDSLDDADADEFGLGDNAPAAEETAATEETSVEDASLEEVAVEDAPVEEASSQDAPAEDVPAEDVPAETVAEEVSAEVAEAAPVEGAPQETVTEATPVDATPVEKEEDAQEEVAAAPATDATAPAEEEESPAYSDEDFAAAAEMDVRTAHVRTFHAPKHTPVPVRTAPARQTETAAETPKQAAKVQSAGEHERIYAKPIAIILAVLSLLFVLVDLTYGLHVRGNYSATLLSALPSDISAKIVEALPVFGGENFPYIITVTYYALLLLIAIFAFTGKKGKVGSILFFIGTLVIGVYRMWMLHGGTTFFIPYEGLLELLETYGSYILGGGYALLMLAGIFYLVALSKGKETYAISFGPGVFAMIFSVIVFLASVAVFVGPAFMENFPDISEFFNYGLLGIFGATILLTLIGVHRADLSRSANGYLAAFMLMFFGFLSLVGSILPNVLGEMLTIEMLIAMQNMIRVCGVMTTTLTIGAAGFALADIRN